MKIVVYHDKRYPSAFIDSSKGYPDKISKHLNKSNIPSLDADQLEQFIEKSINQRNSHRKIIIFSQDVVPDTICEEAHSNTLFREYLDAGGNVIWFGDIPLFYIGTKLKESQHAWKSGAPVYMLGILPLFSSTNRSVQFTNLGRHMGLTHHWTSARPVLKDKTITPLAISQNIGTDYYINIPRKRAWYERLWSWIKRTESVEFAGFKFQTSPAQTKDDEKNNEKPYRSTLYETHVSAWIKSYNEDFPYCGFYRIWDYLPRIMPFWMLDELYDFVMNVSVRIDYRSAR